ncbi:MAG: redoxin domain-containing protein, partial [Planctomycetota bacterium]
AANCSGHRVENFAGALSMAQKPIESRLTTILESNTCRRRSSRLFRVWVLLAFMVSALAISMLRPFEQPAYGLSAQVPDEKPAATLQKADDTDEPEVGMIELPDRITGRIVDQKGQPIAGATADVNLLPYTQWNVAGQDKKFELPLAKSDENGVFSLKTKGIRVPGEGFKISGDFYSPMHPKRGLGISVRSVAETLEQGKPIEIGNFDLVPGRIITGRIVAMDADGMSKPDPVEPFVWAARGMPNAWFGEIESCDEDGNFEILIPKAGQVELLVGSQNYAGVRVQVPIKESSVGEISLFEGTEVIGRLVDLNGDPVAGAVVQIEETGEDKKTKLEAISFEIESSTQTDADGKFRIPPHRGKCRVSVVKRGRERGSNEILKSTSSIPFKQQTVTLNEGEKEFQVDLVEAATVWIHGTIRWPDGRPCPGVEFRSEQAFFKTESDEQGNYSIRALKDKEQHHISSFGAKSEDGVFYYAKAPGELGLQHLRLRSTGSDIEDVDWTLFNLKHSSHRKTSEADQAMDEISSRLNEKRKAYFKMLKGENVSVIDDSIRYGERSPYHEFCNELLEFEVEYRGEYSALLSLKHILDWSNSGLSTAQEKREEVFARIRQHYLDHADLDIFVEQFSGSPMERHLPHVPRLQSEKANERELLDLIKKSNSHDRVQAKIMFEELKTRSEVIAMIDSLQRRNWVVPPISTRDELMASKELNRARLVEQAESLLAELKSTFPDLIRRELERYFILPSEDIRLRVERESTRNVDEFMTYAAKAEAIFRDAVYLQPGNVVPEIIGKDACGKPFALSDLRGKSVVLYFSGIWAADTFSHHFEISRGLRKKHEGKLEVVTIMLDEKAETIREAIASGEITWPAIHDGRKGPISKAWNIEGLDREVFLIDGNGLIVRRVSQREDLEELVEKMLQANAS